MSHEPPPSGLVEILNSMLGAAFDACEPYDIKAGWP